MQENIVDVQVSVYDSKLIRCVEGLAELLCDQLDFRLIQLAAAQAKQGVERAAVGKVLYHDDSVFFLDQLDESDAVPLVCHLQQIDLAVHVRHLSLLHLLVLVELVDYFRCVEVLHSVRLAVPKQDPIHRGLATFSDSVDELVVVAFEQFTCYLGLLFLLHLRVNTT